MVNNTAEVPLDLSRLSRGNLERIFQNSSFPEDLRAEACTLHDLSDPNGMLVPVEGADLSKEWTIRVKPSIASQIERLSSE